MRSKLLTFIIFLMISVAAIAFAYFYYLNHQAKAINGPTVDEIVESSLEIPEIVTNLLGDEYIRVSFTIETDSEETKSELEKLDFRVNNIIIKHLSNLESKELEGLEGKTQLENDLKEQINEVLPEGKVVKVYITSIVIQ